MRLASFALLAACAINVVTAAPAPPADPNVFSLPNAASQGGNKVVLPATDPNVNRQDISNLTPSKTATLQYAEAITSGTYAASLKFKMIYPQVALENSALVTTLGCSKDSQTMTITLQTKAAYDVATQWPQSKLVLITNNATCNPTNERGVYMVNSHSGNANTLTITLQVNAKTWADVSETLEITYGNLIAQTTSKTSSTSSLTTTKSSLTSSTAPSKTTSHTTLTTTTASTANKMVCNFGMCYSINRHGANANLCQTTACAAFQETKLLL